MHGSVKLKCDIPDAFNRKNVQWHRLKIDNEGNSVSKYIHSDRNKVIDPEGNLLIFRVENEDLSSFNNIQTSYYCAYLSINYENERFNGTQIYLNVIDDGEADAVAEIPPHPLYVSPNQISVLEYEYANL